MIALALLLQTAAAPTVGDTIWVRHAVRLPPGATARVPDWQLTGDVELLGRPLIQLEGDSAVLRAPLVVWTPGVHEVEVPAPALLAPDGSVATPPPRAARLVGRGTLPDRPLRELAPQPGADVVPRRSVSFLPLLLAVVLGLALLAPLWWWWRRRGHPVAPAPPPAVPDVPAEQWADVGETRSVLAASSAALRRAVAAGVPEAHEGLDTATCMNVLGSSAPHWPLAEIARLLGALDAARFAPGEPDEVLQLHREALALADRLTGAVP